MASSGSIEGAHKSGCWLTFEWSSQGQDVSSNSMVISWSMKFHRSSSLDKSHATKWTTDVSGTGSGACAVIDGDNASSGTRGSLSCGSGGGTWTLKSGLTRIRHNDDGTAVFNFKGSYSVEVTISGTYVGTISVSGNQTLDNIPRQSYISGYDNNAVINGSSGMNVYIGRYSDSFLHTVTIRFGGYSQTNYNCGTSSYFAIPIDWLNAIGGASSGTGGIEVTTYLNGSQIGNTVYANYTLLNPGSDPFGLSSGGFDVNGSNSITVNINRVNSNFYHTVTYSFYDLAPSYSNIGTSHTYTPPLDWLNKMSNVTSSFATVSVTTYYNGINLGTRTATFNTYVPSWVTPTIGSLSFTGVDLHRDLYVRTHSRVKATINDATGYYGATITSYLITGPNLSVSASNGTSSLLSTAGTLEYKAVVTDSRGRTSSITNTINVTDYQLPTAQISAVRGSYDEVSKVFTEDLITGTWIKATPKFTYSSDIVNLTVKQITVSDMQPVDVNGSDTAQYISGADVTLSYDVTLTITDEFGNSVIANAKISTGKFVMNVLEDKGISFGMVAEEGLMSIGYALAIRGGSNYTALSSQNLDTYDYHFGEPYLSDTTCTGGPMATVEEYLILKVMDDLIYFLCSDGLLIKKIGSTYSDAHYS